MHCHQCGTENPGGGKYCSSCGSELAAVCSHCGTTMPPQAKRCFNCGALVHASPVEGVEEPSATAVRALKRLAPSKYVDRLLATRGKVRAERRVVTFLRSDVRSSTAMTRGLDPEEVMEVMDNAFDVLIKPVYRYEGTLARLEGDAILAFFGAPIAHEDDPERACRAALEIIAEAQRYAEKLEQERGIQGFDVRVGISTGLVVVGEVGSDLRVEYTAMGDAIWLAKRVETAAEPGTVLITEDTHKLIAPVFETQALEPIQVKGKAEPVSAYRVLAPKEVSAKPRGIAGLESPLVGRGTEFAKLLEALERLQAGVGGIVTLVGEAGIGKSRLVAELRKQTPRLDLTPQWIEGRCLSYGTSTAYLLWLDALRNVVGSAVEDPPISVRSAVQHLVESICPDQFDEIYPYLARVMSLPLEDEVEAELQSLEGKQLRAGTFRAVETLIESAARDHPLVLVCEDLHWADPTSVALLQKLLAVTDRAPLLILCVFRLETGHASWQVRERAAHDYRHRYTDLSLEPLSPLESEKLVGHLLGLEDLPPELKKRILRHAEGNPFFVEEILRSLIDDGSIRQHEATDRWWAAKEGIDVPIPDTLQGVLTARIDRLPEEPKRLLRMAAVIGRIFHYRVLAAVAQNETELGAHLLTLQREGMIRERAIIPEPEYIFKHHLTREAAYSGLLKSQRLLYHRRVAEALEKLRADRMEEQVELLAYHWEQGGDLERAIGYLIQAGDRARRLGTSPEAIDLYQSALQKTSRLQAPEKAFDLGGMHERIGDVYLTNLSLHDKALEHYGLLQDLAESQVAAARGARKVATVHLLQGNLTEAQAYYEVALSHLNPLPPQAEASRIHYGLSYLLLSRNELDAAEHHARLGLDVARQVHDLRGMADANKAMGTIAKQHGELEAACRHHERSLELYRQLGDLPRTAQACNNVGDSYRLWGQMTRALEHLEEGLELARRVGDTRDEALLLITTAEVLLNQGRWERAIDHLEQALSFAEESGVVARLIPVHWFLGSAYQGAGRLADAGRHLQVAADLSRRTQHHRYAPGIYLDLSRLSITQGDFDRAHEYLQRAEDAAAPKPSEQFLGLLHRCYGELYGVLEKWDESLAHLERSLECLNRAKLPAEVGRTSLSLGMVYASRSGEGDRGRACAQLHTALSLFRSIEARGYAAQVEIRLKELRC